MEEEVRDIFERWEKYLVEQYIPEPQPTTAPAYKPTPLNAGPKAISIEEYFKRTAAVKKQPEQLNNVQKKKKRAGKRFQGRKQLAILYQRLTLTTTKEESQDIKRKIKQLKK